MKNETISVVVPVYKVEPYLRECVDSIINQTYQNLEIILVDDGSPDGCGAICDEYAAKDARVRVIHQANGGVSSARNAGIEAATGDYIGFVDSDDWIEPEMYEELMSTIIEKETKAAVCSFCRFGNDGEKRVVPIAADCDILSDDTLIKNILFTTKAWNRAELGPCVWNKLFTKECWNNVRFDETMVIGEDFWAWLQIAAIIGKCALCDQPLYVYRQNDSGAIATTDYIKHSNFGYETAKKIVSLFSSNISYQNYKSIGLENLIVRFFISVNYYAMYRKFDAYKMLRKDFLQYRTGIRNECNNIGKKYRIGLFCIDRFPYAFWIVSRIRMKRVTGG